MVELEIEPGTCFLVGNGIITKISGRENQYLYELN